MKDRCLKTKYASEKHADEDIERIKNKSKRDNIPIRSYFCTRCLGWHLTSKRHEAEYEVDELREENKKLKEALENAKREDQKQLNLQSGIDNRIRSLHSLLSKKQQIIKTLRKDNSELIAKIVQLEKGIKNKM